MQPLYMQKCAANSHTLAVLVDVVVSNSQSLIVCVCVCVCVLLAGTTQFFFDFDKELHFFCCVECYLKGSELTIVIYCICTQFRINLFYCLNYD
jgi:hypothetical protein